MADPDGVKKRIDELKAERALWDNWHTNPSLVAQLRGDDQALPQTQPNAPQDNFLTAYDESTLQAQEANSKALAKAQNEAAQKAEILGGVDSFTLDMGNVPADDGGATFDMFSSPAPAAQSKPSQEAIATENKTVSAPTYDTIADNQEIVPSKSGEPFKSASSAKISNTFKNTPNAEIKQIGDKQFVVVKAKTVNESTSSTQEQLKNDFQDYPVKIMESIIENGQESMLYKSAGVKNGYAFSNLSREDQATAYANFVSSGGKSVTGLPTDYNQYVMDEENKIKQRQLQSLHSIQQENGKPFKTEASAKQYQEKYNLRNTHDVVSVGKGFELKKVSVMV